MSSALDNNKMGASFDLYTIDDVNQIRLSSGGEWTEKKQSYRNVSVARAIIILQKTAASDVENLKIGPVASEEKEEETNVNGLSHKVSDNCMRVNAAIEQLKKLLSQPTQQIIPHRPSNSILPLDVSSIIIDDGKDSKTESEKKIS